MQQFLVEAIYLMQVPNLQLGPAARFANDSQLFHPVASLLESPIPEQSKAALQVSGYSSGACNTVSGDFDVLAAALNGTAILFYH